MAAYLHNPFQETHGGQKEKGGLDGCWPVESRRASGGRRRRRRREAEKAGQDKFVVEFEFIVVDRLGYCCCLIASKLLKQHQVWHL